MQELKWIKWEKGDLRGINKENGYGESVVYGPTCSDGMATTTTKQINFLYLLKWSGEVFPSVGYVCVCLKQ